MFCIFTCMLCRRILIYLFKLSQIWRIKKNQNIYYAINEDETPYDPLQHLKSKPVQNKFLEKNKRWLLENLKKLITPDALERHKDYLMYHYETLLREKNHGKLQNKYDISSDDSENDISDTSVKLNKRQERIAIWWLNRGKRLYEMKRLVDGIISSNLQNNCEKCGINSNLQIKQFISIENLVYQYDKKIKLGINRMDKMHPVISWRKYFSNHQLFKTLCDICLANIRIKKIDNNNKDFALISDDSQQDENDNQSKQINCKYKQYQVSFDKISQNIAALWLQGARGRILRQNPPQIPSLSISSSPISNIPIIRHDISSITQTDSDDNDDNDKQNKNVMVRRKRDDISDDTTTDDDDDNDNDNDNDENVFYNSDHDETSSTSSSINNVINNRAIIRRDDISSDTESDD